MANSDATIRELPPATWHLTVKPSRRLRVRLKLSALFMRIAARLLNAEPTITVEVAE